MTPVLRLLAAVFRRPPLSWLIRGYGLLERVWDVIVANPVMIWLSTPFRILVDPIIRAYDERAAREYDDIAKQMDHIAGLREAAASMRELAAARRR